MHMMPFMKVFALLPFIPALFVFGMGMVLLHYAKKESSCALKWGGWVMTIGTMLIMLCLAIMIVKHHFHKEMNSECMPGMECPMMQGMHPGPNPMMGQPQQPTPPTPMPHPRHK